MRTSRTGALHRPDGAALHCNCCICRGRVFQRFYEQHLGEAYAMQQKLRLAAGQARRQHSTHNHRIRGCAQRHILGHLHMIQEAKLHIPGCHWLPSQALPRYS
ncbi:hypothetical protein Vafri_1575 [Volvox africanus]|nr:hypothetical protein Vafri_1575 [Volvox africanus]